MTPEEAKTKWCPFAHLGATYNRLLIGPGEGECQCISDKCMAWRWKKLDPEQGFCGLAGIPE